MFRFLTAGESHGQGLLAIIEGLPAGIPLRAEDVDAQLARRQGGYGRGGRMQIEKDQVTFVSGVRGGRTLGSPIGMTVQNRDWPNWTKIMDPAVIADETRRVTRLRPGHADLPGAVKYGHEDVRNVLERASARETTMRVAVGAVCRTFLAQFGIALHGHVTRIGPVEAAVTYDGPGSVDWERAEQSPVRVADAASEAAMIQAIDEAREAGDTLGGIVEVVAEGVPIGLGSHVHWDRRLDARIAWHLMSIHTVKAVEIGDGYAGAARRGSQVHDIIAWGPEGWEHRTNRAGGIVGGMTNGAPIVARAALKPISTLKEPLPSVDLVTKEEVRAHYERSDVCVVPAGVVVAEAMLAIALTEAMVEKFGGDSLAEMRRNYESYVATYRP
jgi:chorismate synthase